MIDPDAIASMMATSALSADSQRHQTRFRAVIAETWAIPPGSKILEVGCGQGDTTAVLATLVGPSGHVTAVDIGPPDYGAPVSLGASARHLLDSPLGSRIDFHFQYDVLDETRSFPDDAFDYVVLAHCSWYFASSEQLKRTLQRIRPWARHLCFSEWTMEPQTFDQVAHMLAVLIQGQLDHPDANIRTPLSQTGLKALLAATGWPPTTEHIVNTDRLLDAQWEIDLCLQFDATEFALPEKRQTFLRSQLDLLRAMAGKGPNRSLPSYALVAERASD